METAANRAGRSGVVWNETEQIVLKMSGLRFDEAAMPLRSCPSTDAYRGRETPSFAKR